MQKLYRLNVAQCWALRPKDKNSPETHGAYTAVGRQQNKKALHSSVAPVNGVRSRAEGVPDGDGGKNITQLKLEADCSLEFGSWRRKRGQE